MTHQEFKVQLDNGVVRSPVRVGVFYCRQGGCSLWFSCLDIHALVCPRFAGKRSEWLQKRMVSWANMLERYDLPPSTIKKYQAQKEKYQDDKRVLPWHGFSSVGMVAALATMGCCKPNLGGVHEVEARKLCLNALSCLILASGLTSWKLRMDPHVRLLASGDGGLVMVSEGLEVEIALLDGGVVDLTAWIAACQAESASKSAKNIIRNIKLDSDLKVSSKL